MKTKSLKNAIAVTSLLIGLAGASSAQANSPQVRCETLGFPPWATDVYQLTCPIGTTGLSGQVIDLLPVVPPLVSLQIFTPRPGVPYATNTTDPIDGDGNYSSLVSLNKGPGRYFLLVDKTTGMFSEQYCISVLCNNGPSTPIPVLIQDQ